MIDEELINFDKSDVFTPDDISYFMSSKLNKNGNLLEPAVGVGNLLKHIDTDKYEYIDVYDIKKEYLDSIDINVNKYNSDFLQQDINKKYDNIIMNPPYIKIQDLSIEYRQFLKNNFNIIGLVDIYYAFIIKCLNLLKDTGIMVAIIPNTYLYNKSALELRKYLFDNGYIEEIVDYGDTKVFKNISVYCCITIFTKKQKEYIVYNDTKIFYNNIIENYSLFNFNNSTQTLKNICKIQNGIATLRDKIYIHSEKLYDEPCWKPIINGKLEKYIIYPYDNGHLIEEFKFKANNPKTYEYLCNNREELNRRDKGNKKYPSWYAFGRTQSIKYINKKCIYIPCFINPNYIEKNIIVSKSILHSNCLRIEPNNEDDINNIIKHIIDNINFIKENSTKRSGGWINISSRTLYDIKLTSLK